MKMTATITSNLSPDQMRALMRDAHECKSDPATVLTDLISDSFKEFDELKNLQISICIV